MKEQLKRKYGSAIEELSTACFGDAYVMKYGGNRRPVGEIGLELECEGLIKVDMDVYVRSQYWALHKEDSLRNGGREFALKKPINIDELPKALQEWNDMCAGSQFMDSIRTSVHVHFNISRYPLVRILSGISAYWLLENALVAYCGRAREGNLFCLRCKDAESQVQNLADSISSGTVTMYCNDNDLKYGSLNLMTMTKFGSLEIRPMRGLYRIEDISEWVMVCYLLLKNSIEKFANPEEVLNQYFKVGLDEFVLDLIPIRSFVNKLKNSMCENTWAFREAVENNIPYVFEIVRAIPDWSWLNKVPLYIEPLFEGAEGLEEDEDLDLDEAIQALQFGQQEIHPEDGLREYEEREVYANPGDAR